MPTIDHSPPNSSPPQAEDGTTIRTAVSVNASTLVAPEAPSGRCAAGAGSCRPWPGDRRTA